MKNTILVILMISFFQSTFAQTDKEGSQDHPLIQRFKQSYIYNYETTSFEPYTIVTGKSDGSKFTATQEVEGKVYRIFYSLPTDAGSVHEFIPIILMRSKAMAQKSYLTAKMYPTVAGTSGITYET